MCYVVNGTFVSLNIMLRRCIWEWIHTCTSLNLGVDGGHPDVMSAVPLEKEPVEHTGKKLGVSER